MADPGLEETIFPSDRTQLGRELNEQAERGREALFHWLVFPFPLALIPLAWLSRLPFVGLLAGVAGLVVLILWAMRARAPWGDKAGPLIAAAWDFIAERALTTFSRGTLREYRFAGEKAAQAEEARNRVSELGLMASADLTDATQARMATEIEHGAEERLQVLLAKPRLTIIEKGERDAIQRHLQARRAGFGPALGVSAPMAPQGFLGALPVPGLRIPIAWVLVAVLALVSALQTLRVERVKNDARDLQDAVAAETDRANAAETQARMNEVALESTRHEVNVSRELNETLQARQERLEARQRRSSREQVDAARGGRPVDLDGRLRELTLQPFASPDPGASPAADPAGGMHERPAGALDLSTPGALPTGDDGASEGGLAQ